MEVWLAIILILSTVVGATLCLLAIVWVERRAYRRRMEARQVQAPNSFNAVCARLDAGRLTIAAI